MLKSELLRILQTELRKHYFRTFVDQPPSIAQGGKGVVVPGCVPCQKHCNTHTSFLEHLTNDVLPKIIDALKA